jgi:hypothetical protein
MEVYVNRLLDVQTVAKIRTECDLAYVPRVTFPLNRTIVNIANKTAVQLDINCNICEVIVDSAKVEMFKNLMLPYIINFLIDSMKKMMPVKVLNEIGFKLNMYVPQNSNITFVNTVKSDISESSTVFAVPLSSPHHKFTLPFKLTDQYTLISEHQTSSQSFAQIHNSPQHEIHYSTQPQIQNALPITQSPNYSFANVDRGFTFGSGTINSQFGTPQTAPLFGTSQTAPQFGTPQTAPQFGTSQTAPQFGNFSSTSPNPFSGFDSFATPSFGNISTPPFTGFGTFK